jgi:hypothetical protein
LALHPDTVFTLLQITGVVENQHPAWIAERVDHVTARVVADRVGVPDRLAQQPLHAMRRGVPGLLSHLPTRPAVHIRQQAEQKRPRLPTRLHPTEPARNPREPGVELRQPPVGVYAMPSGRRSIFGCPHKPSMIIRRPPQCPQTRRPA